MSLIVSNVACVFNEARKSDKTGTTLLAQQNDLTRDIVLAASLLTRLPLKPSEDDYAHSAKAAWAYPLVGVITGVIACLSVYVAWLLGLPLWCQAILAIASGIIVTGAMHEDGLADCADGFWGGWDPAMRLKIMKDSQIGTYGVLALLITQSLRVAAVLEILRWDSWALPLIAIHIASRAVMPVLMTSLPHARDVGLARSVGKVSSQNANIALGIGFAALLVGLGFSGLFLALVEGVFAFACARLALVKIGGQTGDVCGGTQQVTEIGLLLAVIAG